MKTKQYENNYLCLDAATRLEAIQNFQNKERFSEKKTYNIQKHAKLSVRNEQR